MHRQFIRPDSSRTGATALPPHPGLAYQQGRQPTGGDQPFAAVDPGAQFVPVAALGQHPASHEAAPSSPASAAARSICSAPSRSPRTAHKNTVQYRIRKPKSVWVPPIGADRLQGAEQSCGKVTGIDLDRGGEIGGPETWLVRPISA